MRFTAGRLRIPFFNRGLAGFLMAAILYAAVAGGLAFLARQAASVVASDYSLNLTNYPRGESRQQTLNRLLKAAQNNRVNLYKTMPVSDTTVTGSGSTEVQAGAGTRLLVVALVGDPQHFPAAVDLQPGQMTTVFFPAFQPGTTVEIRAYAGANVSTVENSSLFNLSGPLYISGNRHQSDSLIAQLEQQGFQRQEPQVLPAAGLPAIFTIPGSNLPDMGVLLIFTVATLLLVSGTVNLSVRRSHIPALRMVSGKHPLMVKLREHGVALLCYGAAVTLVTVALALALQFYNGGAQTPNFLLVYYMPLVFLGALVLLLSLSWSLLLFGRYQLGQILKGRAPLRLLASLAISAQLLAFATVAVALPAALESRLPLEKLQEQEQLWAQQQDLVKIRASSLGEDDKTTTLRMGQVVRRLDQQGKVLLAAASLRPDFHSGPTDLRNLDTPEPGSEPPITVNNAYLLRHPLYDAEGRRIENLPEGPGVIYLAVPTDQKQRIPELAENLKESFANQKMNQLFLEERSPHEPGRSLTGGPDPNTVTPDIRVLYLRPGQQLFTYLPFEAGKLLLENSPVIIFSVSSGFWSDEEYSWHEAAFSDRSSLETTMAEVNLGASSIVTAFEDQAKAIATRMQSVHSLELTVALALATALLATVVITLVYADVSRRRLFAQSIHGWGFLSKHGAYLLLLGLLGMLGGLIGGVLASGVLTRGFSIFIGKLRDEWPFPLDRAAGMLGLPLYLGALLLMLLVAALVCALQTRRTQAQTLREG